MAPYGYPAYAPGRPARDPERRPATVTIAAVLTWIGAGGTAASMLLLAAVLATGGDAFVEQFDEAAQGSNLTLSSDEVLAVGWAITGLFLIWSLASAVLAAFAFRRSNVARILLVVSAVMTALLSLVMVLSGISLVTLVLSVATTVLLFTGGANEWYARRDQGHAGYPQGYGGYPGPQGYGGQPEWPGQQGYPGQPGYPTQPGWPPPDQGAWQQPPPPPQPQSQQQPQQPPPPQEPPERDKPW
jgi:hypothetical protein